MVKSGRFVDNGAAEVRRVVAIYIESGLFKRSKNVPNVSVWNRLPVTLSKPTGWRWAVFAGHGQKSSKQQQTNKFHMKHRGNMIKYAFENYGFTGLVRM